MQHTCCNTPSTFDSWQHPVGGTHQPLARRDAPGTDPAGLSGVHQARTDNTQAGPLPAAVDSLAVSLTGLRLALAGEGGAAVSSGVTLPGSGCPPPMCSSPEGPSQGHEPEPTSLVQSCRSNQAWDSLRAVLQELRKVEAREVMLRRQLSSVMAGLKDPALLRQPKGQQLTGSTHGEKGQCLSDWASQDPFSATVDGPVDPWLPSSPTNLGFISHANNTGIGPRTDSDHCSRAGSRPHQCHCAGEALQREVLGLQEELRRRRQTQAEVAAMREQVLVLCAAKSVALSRLQRARCANKEARDNLSALLATLAADRLQALRLNALTGEKEGGSKTSSDEPSLELTLGLGVQPQAEWLKPSEEALPQRGTVPPPVRYGQHSDALSQPCQSPHPLLLSSLTSAILGVQSAVRRVQGLLQREVRLTLALPQCLYPPQSLGLSAPPTFSHRHAQPSCLNSLGPEQSSAFGSLIGDSLSWSAPMELNIRHHISANSFSSEHNSSWVQPTSARPSLATPSAAAASGASLEQGGLWRASRAVSGSGAAEMEAEPGLGFWQEVEWLALSLPPGTEAEPGIDTQPGKGSQAHPNLLLHHSIPESLMPRAKAAALAFAQLRALRAEPLLPTDLGILPSRPHIAADVAQHDADLAGALDDGMAASSRLQLSSSAFERTLQESARRLSAAKLAAAELEDKLEAQARQADVATREAAASIPVLITDWQTHPAGLQVNWLRCEGMTFGQWLQRALKALDS